MVWQAGEVYASTCSCRCSCLALLLIKAGDVETNPGPTTTPKTVCICDICYQQMHDSKQISIRCNRIEYFVHLRCAGIHRAQYNSHPSPLFPLCNTYTTHIISSPTAIYAPRCQPCICGQTQPELRHCWPN